MNKLLCIIDSLNVGGAETFLMKLLRTLPSSEYQFDFIVSSKSGYYTEEVLERGGKIYVVPPRRKNLYQALNQIKAIVKDGKYQNVLRLGDSPIVGLDLLAAKFGGAKHLAFRSCNALTNLSFMTRTADCVFRPILNYITETKIAPSKLAAEFTFGKNEVDNVHILHNGVDLNLFKYDQQGRDSIRQEFKLSDKIVVGHIGRFTKQKNHEFLMEVFSQIQKKCTNSMLLLVGVGEDLDKIKSLISEKGLDDYVILAGQRFDIPQILSAMDVFVFPSLHEGMPNTVIEAQATGLPCVIANTITAEANITGLVKYLSLSTPANEWANIALSEAKIQRRDTYHDFIRNGYDIKSVAFNFITLLGFENLTDK